MKKLLLSLAAFAAFVMLNLTYAADVTQAHKSANIKSSKLTAEDKLLAVFKNKYPATSVTSVRKSDISGLFEVAMGKNIAYTDATAKYLLFGHIIDIATQTDLTQARIDELSKIDFAALPLDKAIKVVKGNGKRVFAVFTDPDCPYCKRLEDSLGKEVDNYTMYVFMFPIAGLHPESESHANAIWCAKDKTIAWHDFMLTNKLPEGKADCTTPTQELIALGQNLGVQGTPTLFRVDGSRLPGALPSPQLNAWLDGKSIQMGR